MGFKVPSTILRLKFEDEEFAGLEIRARSLPLESLFQLQEAQEKADQDSSAAREVMRTLGDAIIEWNLEDDDGNPVKPGADGLLQLDIRFAMAILNAWQEAMVSVPNRLLAASNGGETSLERLIQMDVSSPSPGS